MDEKRTPISPREALEKILASTRTGELETIKLEEAEGRYLAEDIVADHPVPMFNRSSFDGFAIRSEDTLQASFANPLKFRVIEAIAAGEVAKQAVGKNEVSRIMTGAQMPEGANAVIALELTKEVYKNGETYIEFNRPISRGDNVSLKGEDTKQDTVICQKGRRVSAGEMAMLATFGYAEVKVYKQPVVGIYVTGTELLPVESPLVPGKIRNSNSYMLYSQIRRIGAIPRYLGILPDDFCLCYESVIQAFDEIDFLITTGGASVGDFDYVQPIIKKMKAKLLFNKVAMRPGSVTTVALKENKWFFGLSGNPSACYVGFELFTRPVLKAALGSSNLHLPKSKAIVTHDFPKTNTFTRYIRAKAIIKGHQVEVSTIGLDKSGVASSLVDANALLLIPPGTHGVKQGEVLDIMWLERPVEGIYYE